MSPSALVFFHPNEVHLASRAHGTADAANCEYSPHLVALPWVLEEIRKRELAQ